MVDIAGMDKSTVLAALYNNARVQGMGMMMMTPIDMTEKEAQALLDTGQTYFDYVKGRVMKVDLNKDELDTDLYNRDNGAESAEKVIESLRS